MYNFSLSACLSVSLLPSGVFSMDEDSLSHDCEPFFESDGEEESTDGEYTKHNPPKCSSKDWPLGVRLGHLY